MECSVMTGEVDDEALDHGLGDSLVLKEQMDIKEISGVLAIEGCHELAAVEFCMGQGG
jgi:hypothetical protein